MRLLDQQSTQVTQSDDAVRLMAVRRLLQDEEIKLKQKISDVQSQKRVVETEYNDYVRLYSSKIAPLKDEVETLEARRIAALVPVIELEKSSQLLLQTTQSSIVNCEKLLKLVESKQVDNDKDSLKNSDTALRLVNKQAELDSREASIRKQEIEISNDRKAVDGLRQKAQKESDALREKLYANHDAQLAAVQIDRRELQIKVDKKTEQLEKQNQQLIEREQALKYEAEQVNNKSIELVALKDVLDQERERLKIEQQQIESKQQTLKAGFDELRKHNKL